MNQEAVFPYQLDRAFFVNLQARRAPQVPEQVSLKFSVGVRVQDQQFPDKLQVDIKLETVGDDQPFTLIAELVGLFVLVENVPEPTPDIIPTFVNKWALHLLWPYMAQMLRIITGQMGTNPIDFRTPYAFQVELLEEH
jgi:hypothetical protein